MTEAHEDSGAMRHRGIISGPLRKLLILRRLLDPNVVAESIAQICGPPVSCGHLRQVDTPMAAKNAKSSKKMPKASCVVFVLLAFNFLGGREDSEGIYNGLNGLNRFSRA